MAHFYAWSFSLNSAPDLEQLKAAARRHDSEAIQTPDGVCIRSPLSAGELGAALREAGLESPALRELDPASTEALTPDVREFVTGAGA